MSKGGAWSALYARLRNAVSRRELVGSDAFGNSFYRKMEVNLSGDTIERRYMEAKNRGSFSSYDPKAVEPQWRQWLSKTRKEPPSEAEMASEAARRAQLQIKVAQLAGQERMRRMQAQAAGEEPERAKGPSLDRFIGQLTGKEAAPEESKQSQREQHDQQSRSASQKKADSEDFEPEAWRPGR